MLTSGCPSDFHHVQTTALHAHIQWSTACTHLVVHRMHTSSGPPDAAHPVVHRMRHIRWTTSGTFPDAWGCDIRWSTGGQPVDHRMWRSPVYPLTSFSNSLTECMLVTIGYWFKPGLIHLFQIMICHRLCTVIISINGSKQRKHAPVDLTLVI